MFSNSWKTILKALRKKSRARLIRNPIQMESLESRHTPSGIVAVGASPGSAPIVNVYDASSQTFKFSITAYDQSFTGGVNVAIGDVNGDGIADIITGTGPGGGADVRIFSGVDGSQLGTMTAGDADSRSGVTVAAADFDSDGKADVVIGTMLSGSPFVQITRFSDNASLRTFSPSFAGATSVNVAAGDINGDGTPDVVVAPGSGASPLVIGYSGADGSTIFSQSTFEDSFTGGVHVAVGDFDQDGKADIITAASIGGGPRVQVFSGASSDVLQNFFAYDSTLRNGVLAYAFDADGNGTLNIVTAEGSDPANQVTAFDYSTLSQVSFSSFTALPISAEALDQAAPTVTITSTSASVSKSTPFSMQASFSEAVNGFTASDITVSNGTVSNFTAVNARTYSFDVTPTAEGLVSISIAAGVASDVVGYGNTASSTATVTWDLTPPNLTADSLTTNLATPTLTGTIDDSSATVTVEIAGQNIQGIVSGTTWSANVPASLDAGTYSYTITATDVTGNTNSITGTVTVDLSLPTVEFTSDSQDTTADNPIAVTATFSEAVTGFTASDIVVTNGSAINFVAVSDLVYTFDVVPNGTGAITIQIPAAAVTDVSGNANTASDTFTRTFNGEITTVTIVSNTLASTNVDSIPVTVTFNQDVTGFDASDLAVTNGTVENFTANSASIYSFDIIPTADGEVTVSIAAGAALDSLSQPTAAADLFVRTIDHAAPVANISSSVTNATNSTSIPVQVSLNETVTGFDQNDMTIENGTIENFTQVDETHYTFNLVPTAEGTIQISIAAGAFNDAANNTNAASNSLNIAFDSTAPEAPTLAGLNTDSDTGVSTNDGVTKLNTITVTGTAEPGSTVELFADPGTGDISQGTTVTSENGDWSLTFSEFAEGAFNISATAKDAAGNISSRSASKTITVDATLPLTTIDTATTNVISGTADGTSSAVSSVQVSVLDSATGKYWDGTGFNSQTEQLNSAVITVVTDTTATWSLNLPVAGTGYTVKAITTDLAGNQFTASQTVTVSQI